MSSRKLIRAIQHLLEQIGKLARTLTKGLVSWLLRSLLIIGRRPLLTKAGFVLPTTVLLLLVVTLTVGSIAFRTFTRTTDAIGERQQRVIYNAATPAIDRAKAKLEFLFDAKNGDPRYPNGIPQEEVLVGMMLNDGRAVGQGVVVDHYPPDQPNYDPYTFPGETRLDLGQNAANPASAGRDNAWWYRADLNGDGVASATDPRDGIVAYSVVFQNRGSNLKDTTDQAMAQRADRLQVRHGPLSISGGSNSACAANAENGEDSGNPGWSKDTNQPSVLKKNFQVNAFVLPNDPSGTVSTLEFHQDREIRQGNKWGAWFRNDLEIFPGPQFNWNGAMHTEGNLIVGKPSAGTFTSYLISSRNSCLFEIENSVVTVTAIDANAEQSVPKFYGQVLSGLARDNSFGGNAIFHLQRDRQEVTSGAEVQLNPNRDSVDGGPPPVNYALDPIELFTEGNSRARGVPSPLADTQTHDNDAFWSTATANSLRSDRIYRDAEEPPYVDDSYRADNRWGPKPKINGEPIEGNIGDAIPASRTDLIENDPSPGAGDQNVGLDGYWERRARREGLRLIVGQRLELGDAFGWNGPTNPAPSAGSLNREPLRPWLNCTSNNAAICNEARQRRTLRDNLPAVQATAVYHAANPAQGGRDYPLACLATTVHPGTGYLLERSATFEDLNYDLRYNSGSRTTPLLNSGLFPAGTVISDFFRGRGTNGWEYEVPNINSFTNPTSPLRRALKNLAYFAGDPRGGAPSFTPVQDQQVHPYPSMSMWGDFSMLRRVIDLMESGVSYDALSPADKTTLHTAACSIGMLAYNVHYLYRYEPYSDADAMGELRAYIKRLWNPTATPPSSGPYAGVWAGVPPVATDPTGVNRALPPRSSTAVAVGSLTPEAIIAGLERWRDLATNAGERDYLNRLVYTAQMIATKEQVWRDLKYGFQGSGSTQSISWNIFSGTGGGTATRCYSWYTAAGNGADLNAEPLLGLCSKQPRYPVLYALFANTTIAGTGIPELAERTRDSEDSSGQNWNYISNANNGSSVYQRIDTTIDAEMQQLELRPRLPAQWVLPRANAGAGATPNSNRDVLIRECSQPCIAPNTGGNLVRVAFKDSAMYNGREMMNVRTLDMNLGFMRTAAYSNDFWLPRSGIIYAFREDAVAENNIVRPASSNWASCSSNANIQGAACRMRTEGNRTAYNSSDPPLNPDNLISPKSVDYYPDPDRRPYGFRLRNGIDLGRTGDNGRGMSLVSDNPVYIQGDFNLHQNAGGTRLEEFTQLLRDDFSNFYERSGRDPNFARAGDRWRPAEILADAVTILSANFCDGSVEDAFLTAPTGGTVPANVAAHYGCQGNPNVTSYMAINRPSQAVTPDGRQNRWQRENLGETQFITVNDSSNPVAQDGGRTPILINREANPVRSDSSNYNGNYFTKNDTKPLNTTPTQTRVNSIIVSGLVPTRENQSYGGLHNFPRFLESWNDLYISGSFLQLSFSSYATGPFDQDAFESGTAPIGGGNGELIKYYSPPNRYWGYDVGLQIAPAGPLAQRFISLESIRNEFYDEPPANDPYISKLCTAIRSVNTNATCPT